MLSRFSVPTSKFEPIFNWLRERPDVQADVWAMVDGRRIALIASGQGTAHRFDWCPWVRTALPQPSHLLDQFRDLEIELDRRVGMKLWATFPSAVTTLGDESGPGRR
jgi:hypothetical protein